MIRNLAAIVLCSLALCLGIATSSVSAKNRLRGNRLDQLHRWCEAQSRRNEKLRVQNASEQWLLLSGEGDRVPTEPREDDSGPFDEGTIRADI